MLECSWLRCGQIYHELKVVYQVPLSELDLNKPAPSTNALQTFFGFPGVNVQQATWLPEPLKRLIQNALSLGETTTFYSAMKKQCRVSRNVKP